jgi:hypothetical protein
LHLETRDGTTILVAQFATATLRAVELPHRREVQALEPDVAALTNVKLHQLAVEPRVRVLKIDQIGRAELLVQSTMTSLKAP